MIRVVEVNDIDLPGRTFNGYDMISDVSNQKIDVKQVVIVKQSQNDNVIKMFSNINMMDIYSKLIGYENDLSTINVYSISTPALYKVDEYKEADIVHFHMFHNTRLSLYSLIKMSRKKKVILTLHDPFFLTGHCVHFYDCDKWENGCSNCKHLDYLFPFKKDNTNEMWKLKKYVFDNSDIEIVVSSKWMYDLVKRSPIFENVNKIHLIPFGINVDKFSGVSHKESRKHFGIGDSEIVLFLRAQAEFKGTEYVLEALKVLNTKKKITVITCDTKGMLDEVKDKYNIIDLGMVAQEEMKYAMNACDIFLMPSKGESFGFMGVEAMSCSKPVIIFDNSAMPSITRAPECGYLVPNRDSKKLAEAIEYLILHPEERKSRGELGRKICLEEYDYEKYNNKLRELYCSAFKRRKKFKKNISDVDFEEDNNIKNIFEKIKNNETIKKIPYIEYSNPKIQECIMKHNTELYNKCLKKVSIIIPVYNGENYVREAIDSALSQTYGNCEVIVVNDGSIDGTDEICKSYGDKIMYFTKENGGVSSALNLAISKMSGEYLSWLSHDDLYLPDKIEIEMNYINKLEDEKAILFSDYLLINSKGKEFKKPVRLNHDRLNEYPFYAFLSGSLNGISMLIPKLALDYAGVFNESLKCTQDYDLWLRMYDAGYKFVHIKELITKTRIHDLQDTNTNVAVLEEGNKLWMKIVEKLSDKEKIEYSGSLYDYYYDQAMFLLETPYVEVKDYCIKKCMEIDKEKYLKNPVRINRNFKYYLVYLKNHGIGYSFRRFVRKIIR
ncbi:MAG: glycosyltransferase [Bacilli bacterium]|nr:glycosyltransferase [Bacilli bacterium]